MKICALPSYRAGLKGGTAPMIRAKVQIEDPSTGLAVETMAAKQVYVDSGATFSAIPSSLLKTLEKGGFKSLKIRKVNISTANGIRKVKLVENLAVCVDRCCAVGPVMVIDKMPGYILVGLDWLKQASAVIDFKHSSMKCDRGSFFRSRVPFSTQQ